MRMLFASRGFLRGAICIRRGGSPIMNAIPRTEKADAIFGLITAHKAAWAWFMELDERDHETFEKGGRAADAAMAKQ
jgi:hypothetical protein